MCAWEAYRKSGWWRRQLFKTNPHRIHDSSSVASLTPIRVFISPNRFATRLLQAPWRHVKTSPLHIVASTRSNKGSASYAVKPLTCTKLHRAVPINTYHTMCASEFPETAVQHGENRNCSTTTQPLTVLMALSIASTSHEHVCHTWIAGLHLCVHQMGPSQTHVAGAPRAF